MELKERIIRAAKDEGMDLVPITENKNGVIKEGLRLSSDVLVSPVIWLEDWIANTDEAAKQIVESLRKAKSEASFDINELISHEYMLEHAKLRVFSKGEYSDQFVGKDYLDLRTVVAIDLEVSIGKSGSYLVRKEMLKAVNLDPEELYKAAYNNSLKDISVKEMPDVLRAAFVKGYIPFEVTNLPDEAPKMLVITNEECSNGAIAGILKAGDIATEENSEYYLIPSSVNEMLMIPCAEEFDDEQISDLVRQVNSTHVAPEEVLADHAYRVSTDGTITAI